MRTRLLCACAVALLAASCSDLRPRPLAYRDAADVTDRMNAPDVVDASDVADASDVRDAPARCPPGMVLIAGGEFSLRDPDAPGTSATRVVLSPYCIDETEVTLGEYVACVAGDTRGQCNVPEESGEPTCNRSGVDGGRAQHPINCIEWADARRFCRVWRGGDLPTEAQWEFAARGMEGRLYPWRFPPPDELPPTRQPCWVGPDGGGGAQGTCEVRANPIDQTPPLPGSGRDAGVTGLAANVAEWVRDWYAPYPTTDATPLRDPEGPTTEPDGGRRVLRGTGWIATNRAQLQLNRRQSRSPTDDDRSLGFRCMRPPE